MTKQGSSSQVYRTWSDVISILFWGKVFLRLSVLLVWQMDVKNTNDSDANQYEYFSACNYSFSSLTASFFAAGTLRGFFHGFFERCGFSSPCHIPIVCGSFACGVAAVGAAFCVYVPSFRDSSPRREGFSALIHFPMGWFALLGHFNYNPGCSIAGKFALRWSCPFCHADHLLRGIPRRSDLLYFPAVLSSRFIRLSAVSAFPSSRFARQIADPSRLLSVLGEVRRFLYVVFFFIVMIWCVHHYPGLE